MKALEQVPKDGKRVGQATLKPPKLLAHKKSLMSRLMQNLSASQDGKGASDKAAEEEKTSRITAEAAGLSGEQMYLAAACMGKQQHESVIANVLQFPSFLITLSTTA